MNDYQYINENGIPRDYYEIVNDNGELCKEIERLNEQIEEYQKTLDETTSEKIDLENIIKEVREYIEKENYKEENICMINGVDILEILDKVGDEK